MSQIIKNDGLRFVCDDPIEVARARTVFEKETGTIHWLREQVQPGDVVFDIGANIGVYTLLAARIVGPQGIVYAFEPHIVNAAQLLRNVAANRREDTVRVLTTALGAVPEWATFYCRSLRPGSSGSALGPVTWQSAAALMVQSASVESLVKSGVGPPADVIKIDVDGRELDVLRGMSGLLMSGHTRSVQVEMAPASSAAILTFMRAHGYALAGRHFTSLGRQAIERGADPATITDNAIFMRAA